jgi:pyruvate,water dikinase
MAKYIINVDSIRDEKSAGSRAYNIKCLKRWHLCIPMTLVCKHKVFEDYQANKANILKKITTELDPLISSVAKYVVHPSIYSETATQSSLTEQFISYLDISFSQGITDAMSKIWEIGEKARLNTTHHQRKDNHQYLKIGIVIQQMITPRISGVVFTQNPVTGFDETIVEVFQGKGIYVTQREMTPTRWVYKWGDFIETPTEYTEYSPLIEGIVLEAQRMAKAYRKPCEIEWAYDGRQLFWLQLRDVTPIRGLNIYSNRISREMLPGMIKPLVWSVNTPLVNSSWKTILTQLVGKEANLINIHALSKAIYYRTYFNMGIFGDIFELLGMPRETIELIMGTHKTNLKERPRMKLGPKVMKYLPRILFFSLGKIGYHHQIERFWRQQISRLDAFNVNSLPQMSDKEILDDIKTLILLNQEISYYVIITQLLMGLWCGVTKRYSERHGVMAQYLGLTPNVEVTQDVNVNYHISLLKRMLDDLPSIVEEHLEQGNLESTPETVGFARFQESIHRFLNRFGHLSDSANDLSRTTWQENPGLVLQLINNYRPPTIRDHSQDEICTSRSRLNFWQRIVLRFFHSRAVRYVNYREKITYLYNYGYGKLRPYFLSLAGRFQDNGYLSDRDDIFYLNFNELEDIIISGNMSTEYRGACKQRKEEMVLYRDIELPEIIIGDSPPVTLREIRPSAAIKGIPASGGHATGRIKVIKTIDEFGKLESGDIMVIPYSDVSWTPLFSKAKAVISASGGLLSHCAIVAREFHIPAVVAVPAAMQLLDGELVSVNGFTGEIILSND